MSKECVNCKVLRASLLEMRNVAAAATRVIVRCGPDVVEDFVAEAYRAGVVDGFGGRAADALGPEIAYVEIFP